MESVSAAMHFCWMMEGVSVMRMRDLMSGWDLDILRAGFWRDITLLAGAKMKGKQFSTVGKVERMRRDAILHRIVSGDTR